MKISDYYRYLKCEKLSQMDVVGKKENRYSCCATAVRLLCKLLAANSSYMDAFHAVKSYLNEKYQDDWFSFYWQKEMMLENDCYAFKRFLQWLHGCSCKIIAANVPVSVHTDEILPDGSKELSESISLVVQHENGTYGALLIFFKKADKSFGGKNVHTAISTDLSAMVAKVGLEHVYPNINIVSVYLLSEDDSADAMVKEFIVSNTKRSNVFSQSFDSYYENNVFMEDYFLELIHHVRKQPMNNPCFECSYQRLCHIEAVGTNSASKLAPKSMASKDTRAEYQMPPFTQEQLKVVNHQNGPMLVCAGPGSGKTATLVGRVQKLVSIGVPAECMLVITFTNKAALELLERCQSFCKNAISMPKIATINALGFEILKANESVLGFTPILLDAVKQMQLVKSLLAVTTPLTGINYNKEYGHTGLYKTVCNKLDKYVRMTPQAFFQSEKTLGADFKRFADNYVSVIRANGYITFDEQVSLCNQLFETHPDILAQYQNLYKYVMVDEFQDINGAQAEFIYSIGYHGNIVVVGDDDQSVYAFRGASNQYMIDFVHQFNNVKTVVLSENFRSTEQIVDASLKLIQKNHVRIPKNIHCNRGLGLAPTIIQGTSPDIIDSLIDSCVRDGISYHDIAILSTKNAPLEFLHKNLSAPTVLAKSYLRNDPLFLSLYDVLHIARYPDDNEGLYHFILLNGISLVNTLNGRDLCQWIRKNYADVTNYDAYEDSHYDDALYMVLRKLAALIKLAKSDISPSVFLMNTAYLMNLNQPESSEAIETLISNNKLHSLDAMYEFLDYMVKFEDETRIERPDSNEVLLITSHESKGREFPVVIMLNDYKESTEDTRRLFYVAMTRAKDRLFILQDHTCTNQFLEDL